MPRGNASTTTVRADTVESNVVRPDDSVIDELMAGVPEEQRNIKLERIAGDDPAAPQPPGLYEAPEGKVLLLNLKYENETFFVPEPDQNGNPRFLGQTRLTFVDGRLVCTQDQADFVKSLAPHVYQEPEDGPVFEFTPTGFKTRVPEAYQEYGVRWADNQ
jgi:hypothetical protein